MSRIAPEKTPYLYIGSCGVQGAISIGVQGEMTGQTMVSTPMNFTTHVFNSSYNHSFPDKEKCLACGQWGTPRSECNHCGYPIDG